MNFAKWHAPGIILGIIMAVCGWFGSDNYEAGVIWIIGYLTGVFWARKTGGADAKRRLL